MAILSTTGELSPRIPGFVALQIVGTEVHGWVINEDGSWRWLGSIDLGAVPTSIELAYQHTAVGNPGSPVLGVDFIRVSPGTTIPI